VAKTSQWGAVDANKQTKINNVFSAVKFDFKQVFGY